jgi:UDP:flavonoid glycosyltransferase YjiC (YdhE family)
MHAILATFGTDGDVHPYVGLGIALGARGHRVTLAANAHFEGLAADLGFGFRALVTHEEHHRFLADPDIWHPIKCGLVGVRLAVGLIPRQYATLAELAKGGDSVLVANPGVVAGRLVQETLGRPTASLVLQPWLIPSVIAPPAMAGGLSLPRWAPRWAGRIYWRLIDAAGDVLVGRRLNRLRRTMGLGPVRRLFRWWLSPDLAIGMFPEWYGPPQRDWPAQMRLAGFSMYDGGRRRGLPRDVLEFCEAGDPPIVFTFGTGMMHAAGAFRAGIDACRALGARGLFLTKYREQLPDPLPPAIHHADFAPFRELLPRCAAIVHHGGAGTVAKALAAGTPQLILPLAWDQPDNAARVERLGAGGRLKTGRRNGPRLAKALRRLLTPESKARCRAAAARFGEEDALETAAGWVEELARRG